MTDRLKLLEAVARDARGLLEYSVAQQDHRISHTCNCVCNRLETSLKALDAASQEEEKVEAMAKELFDYSASSTQRSIRWDTLPVNYKDEWRINARYVLQHFTRRQP